MSALSRTHRATEPGRQDRKILIAVDFGTTFSSIAWGTTGDTTGDRLIRDWPGPSGATAEWVPTTLAYLSIQPPRYQWGYSIPEDDARHEWFKLEIDPTRQGGNSDLARDYPNTLPLPSTHNTVHYDRLVTDYLTALRQHFDQQFQRNFQLYAARSRQYILTVPAVWSQKARNDTLNYAVAAGMGPSNDIQLITEPEAAALYDLDSLSRNGALNVGDIFTVCDAGGGTVDLISYHIDGLDPLRLREATTGTGRACGSVFLNRIFTERLREKLVDTQDWKQEDIPGVVQKFADGVKRSFGGDDPGPFVFRVPGLTHRSGRGLPGRIQFSREEMRNTVFEPVITEVLQLIDEQFRRAREDCGKSPNRILLVGGFGQNRYLGERLRANVGPRVVVQDSRAPETAVVRGALLRLHSGASHVLSRKARTHCGTKVTVEYSRLRHGVDALKEENGYFGSGYQVQEIHWFLTKGTDIEELQPIAYEHIWEEKVANGPPRAIITHLYECATTEAPLLHSDRRVRHIAAVRADFEEARIPEESLERELGPDGQWYYVVKFKIEMTCSSADRRFALIFKGQRYEHAPVQWFHPPMDD